MNTQEGISRRGFLKSAVAVGAALSVGPAWEKVEAATRAAGKNGASTVGSNRRSPSLPHRTLGTGKAAFEVSAFGFGVIGIGFVPYSPMNRGFLGGDLNEYTQFDTSNDNRHTLPRSLRRRCVPTIAL